MAVHQRGCSVCAFFYEDSVDTRSQNFSYLRLFKRMGVCGCLIIGILYRAICKVAHDLLFRHVCNGCGYISLWLQRCLQSYCDCKPLSIAFNIV